MLFHSPSKDKNVIQIDDHNVFCYKVSEDIVYYCLEHNWTISHIKEYYQWFKQSIVSIENYLPFVSRLDMHIVETPTDVKLGEILNSAKLQDKFRDQKERVFVFDSHGVEGSIILDQVEKTVLLLDEEYQGGYRRLRGPSLSSVQVSFEKDIQLLLFYRGQEIHLGQLGLQSGKEFDGMIQVTMLHCKRNTQRQLLNKLDKGPRSQCDIQVEIYLFIQAVIYTTTDGLCTIT